jgi:HSP20 family protein
MVTRWNPFEEAMSLRDAVNRLFDTTFMRPSYWPSAAGATWQGFPMNVYSRKEELVVEVLLPGISQEDVQVEVDRGVLTISAKRHGWQPEEGQEQPTWYLREIEAGQFRRAISLPFPVDTEKAHATYSNGLLTLTLPKAEAARPKQIHIQGGAQPQIEVTATKS